MPHAGLLSNGTGAKIQAKIWTKELEENLLKRTEARSWSIELEQKR